MITYLEKQYFKSKDKKTKKYYFDLYLKEYLKKVKTDNSNLLENYFNQTKKYCDKLDKVLFEFEYRIKNKKN